MNLQSYVTTATPDSSLRRLSILPGRSDSFLSSKLSFKVSFKAFGYSVFIFELRLEHHPFDKWLATCHPENRAIYCAFHLYSKLVANSNLLVLFHVKHCGMIFESFGAIGDFWCTIWFAQWLPREAFSMNSTGNLETPTSSIASCEGTSDDFENFCIDEFGKDMARFLSKALHVPQETSPKSGQQKCAAWKKTDPNASHAGSLFQDISVKDSCTSPVEDLGETLVGCPCDSLKDFGNYCRAIWKARLGLAFLKPRRTCWGRSPEAVWIVRCVQTLLCRTFGTHKSVRHSFRNPAQAPTNYLETHRNNSQIYIGRKQNVSSCACCSLQPSTW